MSERTPARLVIIALISSLSLAALSFTGASWTGAAVMMAVTVQALVGASHQALLLARMREAATAPERDLFASFVVPILLYGLGSGVALSLGTATMTSERAVVSPLLDVLCLALAFGIVSASLLVSLALLQTPDDAARTDKPPSSPFVKAVLIEQAGNLACLCAAGLGIAALALLELPRADGASALAVGLVTALIGAAMALEIKKSVEVRSASSVAKPSDTQPMVEREPAPVTAVANRETPVGADRQAVIKPAEPSASRTHLTRKERRQQKRRS